MRVNEYYYHLLGYINDLINKNEIQHKDIYNIIEHYSIYISDEKIKKSLNTIIECEDECKCSQDLIKEKLRELKNIILEKIYSK
jgi:phenylacetate-coenzyme A ligase PaaK-like adenylate-forming protein